MPTAVTVNLPDALTRRVREGDSTAASEVFTLTRSSLPPALLAGQRYRTAAGEATEIVGFRDDLVILYWPGRADPGSRAGALPLAGVQTAVAEGRWVPVVPPA